MSGLFFGLAACSMLIGLMVWAMGLEKKWRSWITFVIFAAFFSLSAFLFCMGFQSIQLVRGVAQPQAMTVGDFMYKVRSQEATKDGKVLLLVENKEGQILFALIDEPLPVDIKRVPIMEKGMFRELPQQPPAKKAAK